MACASTASYEEYAFAEAALSAARQMKAHTSSPSLYAKARTQFKLGRVEFRKKNYDKANKHFKKARRLAEKAEVVSFIKISKGGGVY